MKSRHRKTLGVIGCVLLVLLVPAALSWAEVDPWDIKNPRGDVVFRLDFYDADEGDSSWSLNTEQKEALVRAAEYWAERVSPNGAATPTVVIKVTTMDDYNAGWAYQFYDDGTGTDTLITAPNDILANDNDPTGGSGFHSNIVIGKMPFTYDPNTQLGAGMGLETIMIHEMGHALGISGRVETDNDGNVTGTSNFLRLLVFDPVKGWVYRNGTNATEVYGDGVARDIPMDNASGQVLSHFGIVNGLMTHREFRNYGGFMEVELAALNDLGYNINLGDFFGRSIYTDNNVGGGTVADFTSEASYAMGLHIFGSNNTVTQANNITIGDIDAGTTLTGYGGTGIRSDGENNKIIVAAGTTIDIQGDYGMGVVVAYGHDSVLVNQGTIKATGTNGDAVRFDIGRNTMGDGSNIYEQASYYEYDPRYFDPSSYAELNAAEQLLAGALVNSFDLTGVLEAERNAIYISPNAHVATINIMDGAEIRSGAIISDYDDLGRGNARATELVLGMQAGLDGQATTDLDHDFEFTINDAIIGYDALSTKKDPFARPYAAGYDSAGLYIGRGKINMTLAAGITTLGANATIMVNEFNLNSDSGLLIPYANGTSVTTISSNNFDLAEGSTIEVTGLADTFLPGPNIVHLNHLDSSGEFINKSTVLSDTYDRGVILGIYGYDRYTLDWDPSRHYIRLHGVDPNYRYRVLAGDYALTATSAMMITHKGWDEVARQSRRSLYQLARADHVLLGGYTMPTTGRLWFGPFYSTSDQSGGGGRTGYDLKTFGAALGYDWTFDQGLVGLAMSASRPEYKGSGTTVDGTILSVMAYAGLILPGQLELGLQGGYDITDYSQTRRVWGSKYKSDYESGTWRAGLSLGRTFDLGNGWDVRPAISHEYFSLDVDAYKESDGIHSIALDSERQNLHRTKLGAEATWRNDPAGWRVSGSLGWAYLSGDLNSRATGFMRADPGAGPFLAYGDKMDKNSADVGLSVALPIDLNWSLEANYDGNIGDNITTHSGELKAVLVF